MTSEGCEFEPCVGCEESFKKIKTLKEEEKEEEEGKRLPQWRR